MELDAPPTGIRAVEALCPFFDTLGATGTKSSRSIYAPGPGFSTMLIAVSTIHASLPVLAMGFSGSLAL